MCVVSARKISLLQASSPPINLPTGRDQIKHVCTLNVENDLKARVTGIAMQHDIQNPGSSVQTARTTEQKTKKKFRIPPFNTQ